MMEIIIPIYCKYFMLAIHTDVRTSPFLWPPVHILKKLPD